MIIINLKTYKESLGEGAATLAKKIERAAIKSNTKIILAVNPLDFDRVKKAVSLDIFMQHTDFETYGSHTGKIIASEIKKRGAKGTLLNHSEYQIPPSQIEKTIKECKKNNLEVVLCVNNTRKARQLSKLKPDFIAIEPPELIGGKISVSTAKPQVITNTIKASNKVSVLCGAGVHTKEDVEIALKLGAKGILIASGVVLNSNPGKEVYELSKAFK
jgi:triosephosphate isomerase